MAKLKFGVIGCGWIGTAKHIGGLRQHPNAELVALCDIVPEKMEIAEKQFNLEGVEKYSDYRDLCSDPAIDVVPKSPVLLLPPANMCIVKSRCHARRRMAN